MPTVNASTTSYRTAPKNFRVLAAPQRALLRPTVTSIPGVTPANFFSTITFPFGPQQVQHQEYNANYVQIPRPGKKAILFNQNSNLRNITFNAVIADKASGGASTANVDNILTMLERLSVSGVPCKFVYGSTSLSFSVAVTKFSYSVKRRNLKGEPTIVDVSLQLTEIPLVNQEIASLQAVYRRPETSSSTAAPTVSTAEQPTASSQASVILQQGAARAVQEQQDAVYAKAVSS